VNSTATTNWGYQATVGAAARTRWSATAPSAAHRAFAAISPMPSNLVVVKDHKGIRHRPPEDSS
jgi:hypothetical protein